MPSGTYENFVNRTLGLYVEWSYTQNAELNCSTITQTAYIKYYSLSVGPRNVTTSINGSEQTFTVPEIRDSDRTKKIGTQTVIVYHDESGHKDGVTLSTNWAANLTYSKKYYGNITASTVINLEPISRGSILNSVSTVMIDEENPYISLNITLSSNYSDHHLIFVGTDGYEKCRISSVNLTNGVNKIFLNDIKNDLLDYVNDKPSKEIGCFVQTIINNNGFINSSLMTTIQTLAYNSKPEFPAHHSFSYSDSNSIVTAVTKDESLLIQNASYLKIILPEATPKNRASIVKYVGVLIDSEDKTTVESTTNLIEFKDTHGIINTKEYFELLESQPADWVTNYTSYYIRTESYEYKNIPRSEVPPAWTQNEYFYKTEKLRVQCFVYDSRGYNDCFIAEIDADKIIPYKPVTIDKVEADRINKFEPELEFSVNGNLSSIVIEGFQKNLLTELSIRWKQVNEGGYGEYHTLSGVTRNNNSYEYYAKPLPDVVLDSKTSYVIEVTAKDIFTKAITTVDVYKGHPLVSLIGDKVGINNSDPKSALDVVGNMRMNSANVFGFVAYLDDKTNLNGIKESGLYVQMHGYWTSPGTNYPTNQAGFLEVIASPEWDETSGYGGVIMQRYTTWNSTSPTDYPFGIWIRTYSFGDNGDNWHNWIQIH